MHQTPIALHTVLNERHWCSLLGYYSVQRSHCASDANSFNLTQFTSKGFRVATLRKQAYRHL